MEFLIPKIIFIHFETSGLDFGMSLIFYLFNFDISIVSIGMGDLNSSMRCQLSYKDLATSSIIYIEIKMVIVKVCLNIDNNKFYYYFIPTMAEVVVC